MSVAERKVVVISHASIKQVNRAVYRGLRSAVGDIKLVIPAQLQLSSGQRILAEPPIADDPEIKPMGLLGRNPRTYFYPQLISWLNDEKPDVIILENDPVSRLGIQLSTWCRRNNSLIVCQSYENLKRDLISTLKQQGWKAILKNQMINFLNWWMASRVDALLVVNRDSEVIFTSYGYKRVYLIPLGYDNKIFFDSDQLKHLYRQKMSVGKDTVIVAYFGRLVKQKGVHLLINALASLQSMPWVLLLDHIHDSEDGYVRYIRQLVDDLNLRERVIYFEADHFEIANYMRAADIAVAASITTPTFKEQYGRAVQEAMACGCITVVSDSGHLKDLVGEQLLVFEEGNVSMLSETLVTLIGSRSRRDQYRAFLTQRAEKFLTTKAQACRLQVLLDDLL